MSDTDRWLGALDAHTRAVLAALFVTVLWSSSYVLIKIGLQDIPPLTFAGLRYGLATLVLLPIVLRQGAHREVAALSRRDLGILVVLGVLLYAVTQGAQFVALTTLSSASVSLVLTFTPVAVALLSVVSLGERPAVRQLAGIAILFAGVAAYFYPFSIPAAHVFGLGVMVLGLLANASASVLGRAANRTRAVTAVGVTAVSMGIGSMLLLAAGIWTQGVPTLTLAGWGIVVWLAVANTAFAFTLWNRSLQELSAFESSVINNTMLAQVAVFGWVFLGEQLGLLEIVGAGLVMVGAAVVQAGSSN